MRLTLSLLSPRMWIHARGQSWFRHRKRRIPDDHNIHRIVAAGYNIVDAQEYVKTLSPLHKDYSCLPDVPGRFPQPPQLDRSHPDWHDKGCKIFNNETFPIEGVQQALAFTKGVQVQSGLPDDIMERVKSIQLTEEEDHQVKSVIQQAFIWDAYLEKLPSVRHLDYPSLNPTRQYGTPWERTNEIMITNFIRLIEGKLPIERSLSRMIAPKEELRVNLERHQSMVQFKLNAILHLVSTNPISPILNSKAVEDTKVLPLCDIYPFLSTSNMEDTNIYRDTDSFGVPSTSKYPHIHTSFFSHHIPGSHTHLHPRWNDDRYTGTTILYNFATALFMAKRRFGSEILGTLPEPITTQVVYLTGKEFQFSVLQLNTLDLEDRNSTSIKNNVWVTEKIPLCSEIKNDYGKEIFSDYNPIIFKLVKAMYLS